MKTKLSEREKKNLEIFNLMTRRGAVSRTEISRETGINMVSVAHYIKEFIGKGLVLETGLDVSSGGRKPELIELDPKKRVIGIEIGPTAAKVALTDLSLKVIEKTTLSLEALLKKGKQSRGGILAIGIGASDDESSGVAAAIEEAFGKKAFIARAHFCAAFGEKTLNRQVAGKDLLYMHSDIGAGVILVKDEIMLGPPVEEKDDSTFEKTKYLCPWGSALEIANIAKREVARGVGTNIVAIVKGDAANITTSSVIEAAKTGDQLAVEIVSGTGINLGLRIAYLINLFYPQMVVIGGDMEKAGDLVFDPVKKMVKRLALEKRSGSLEIVSGELGEDAVSLGAASLAAREVFLKA